MLQNLPTELLDQITTYLPNAQSIAHLSQTSRALHNFAEKEGWRSFTQARFPSIFDPNAIQSNHKDAARSLTTLSRDWDRRAFLARFLEPRGDVRSLSGGQQLKQWKRPRGQTMGFQPAIDVCEHSVSGKRGGLRELLGWSAGAELLVRQTIRGGHSEAGAHTTDTAHGGQQSGELWWSYKPAGSLEGRDDITSVHFLRNQLGSLQSDAKGGNSVLVSTANGGLELLGIPPESSEAIVKIHFETNGRPVRSTTISNSAKGHLLAANLSDSNVALYRINDADQQADPISEINTIPQAKRGCRIWSTKFLDPQTIALGIGPSVEPVHVFDVQDSGITSQPIRKFSLVNDLDDRLDSLGTLKPTSSVYPIEPLNLSNKAGQVFLSGGYDGIIRLHDMRSSRAVCTTYRDPTDDSAIYSLLSRGLDRVVAGTSRHSLLKVFDLRMSGASDYNYLGTSSCQSTSDQMSTLSLYDEVHKAEDFGRADPSKSNWNVFINPRGYPGASYNGANSWIRRSAQSSVYSLASASSSSPRIYAGVENAVVEFTFTSALDKHPDPSVDRGRGYLEAQKAQYGYTEEPSTRKLGPRNHGRSRGQHARDQREASAMPNSDGKDVDETLNLAMYSQGIDDKAAINLRVQQSVADTLRTAPRIVGLDERWVSNVNR